MLTILLPSAKTETRDHCIEGRAGLTEEAFGYDCSGKSSLTGIISVCLNQVYLPVCNSGLDLEGAQRFCEEYYGFSGFTTGKRALCSCKHSLLIHTHTLDILVAQSVIKL